MFPRGHLVADQRLGNTRDVAGQVFSHESDGRTEIPIITYCGLTDVPTWTFSGGEEAW